VVAPDKDHKPKYTERLNGPIQSTAGDILSLTLKKLAADPRPDTHFLLSVHDELILECTKEDARGVALWLKQKMREAMEEILVNELDGPKCAEVGYGPSWGEWMELEDSEGQTECKRFIMQYSAGPTIAAIARLDPQPRRRALDHLAEPNLLACKQKGNTNTARFARHDRPSPRIPSCPRFTPHTSYVN
jgi:hypothetical protein